MQFSATIVMCMKRCIQNNIFMLILIMCVSRLTVVSHEAKKKQHACASSGPRDHYSEYLHGWQL